VRERELIVALASPSISLACSRSLSPACSLCLSLHFTGNQRDALLCRSFFLTSLGSDGLERVRGGDGVGPDFEEGARRRDRGGATGRRGGRAGRRRGGSAEELRKKDVLMARRKNVSLF
jgi:hypothetical protein